MNFRTNQAITCMTLEMYHSTLAFTSVNIILYNVTQLTAIHHNFPSLLYLKYKINNRSSLKFKFKNRREVKAGIHCEIHVAKKRGKLTTNLVNL